MDENPVVAGMRTALRMVAGAVLFVSFAAGLWYQGIVLAGLLLGVDALWFGVQVWRMHPADRAAAPSAPAKADS